MLATSEPSDLAAEVCLSDRVYVHPPSDCVVSYDVTDVFEQYL